MVILMMIMIMDHQQHHQDQQHQDHQYKQQVYHHHYQKPSSLPEKNKELKVLRKRIAEQQILHEQQLRRIRNQIQIEREERERKEREKREEIKAEKERVTRKSHVASRIAAKAGRHAAYNAGVIANEARLAAEKAHRAVRKTKEANE